MYVIINYLKKKGVMMKFQVLELEEREKDGIKYYYVNGLGDFYQFGKMKKATVDIEINKAYYDKLKEMIGKTVDLDVLIPKPTYPLKLAQ